MRRRYLRAITIVIAVCGLVGFGLLWRVDSNFHLQHLSRELLAGKSTEQAIAFVDVNLVPMDSERIVPHQNVIVHDGRIAAIRAAGTLALPAAVRVDGRGRYLMPRLADMHARILISLDDPLRFVANGVTTVRSMSSYAPAAG
jgi:imidazolonepropionase-like amidohydrolase